MRARRSTAPRAEVFTSVCDIPDESQTKRAVLSVVERYGTIDILINNAEVIQVESLESMTVEDFEGSDEGHIRPENASGWRSPSPCARWCGTQYTSRSPGGIATFLTSTSGRTSPTSSFHGLRIANKTSCMKAQKSLKATGP
ncbi:MAG TPA: SDR family NAD(P)-dependent oxidoreductase [Bryobacteraceae bacterium]|nr:SDR family NAD(P)-dependent oxidoreductase [Bryobacteraceae bacterium]